MENRQLLAVGSIDLESLVEIFARRFGGGVAVAEFANHRDFQNLLIKQFLERRLAAR